MIMSKAADFFRSTVEPTVNEYLSSWQDVRRARLAAIVLNQMTDHWAEDCGRRKELDRVRSELAPLCPPGHYSLIRDIADASKHAQLNRRSAALTSSDQVSHTPGLFQAPFGEGAFAEATQVEATLNDGTRVAVDPAIRSVFAMWKGLAERLD